MSDSLLQLQDVSKYFLVHRGILKKVVGRVHAVDHVSLDLEAGETVGLVGESGSGKSTLGRLVTRLTLPDDGLIVYKGTDIDRLKRENLREFRQQCQIVFQNPYTALNPRKKVRSILRSTLSSLRPDLDKDTKIKETLDMVGLAPGVFLDKYPHQLSGGQRQRVAIARAIVTEPSLLVCDEVTSALDASAAVQILNLLSHLKKKMGLTMLFISHNFGAVNYVSDRIAVMYLGAIVEVGTSKSLLKKPLHPYTKLLLSCVLNPDPAERNRFDSTASIGEIPSAIDIPHGCRYNPRCPYVFDKCRNVEPSLLEITTGQYAACHLYDSAPQKMPQVV